MNAVQYEYSSYKNITILTSSTVGRAFRFEERYDLVIVLDLGINGVVNAEV